MELADLGWGPRWAALLAEVDATASPGRVSRHDGAGLLVLTAAGEQRVMFAGRLDPEPVVGDWVAIVAGAPVAVLARSSLLRRRTAHGDEEQPLAANVDAVLLVCGLDRPVRAGRLLRSATLAADAGAEPIVVLTKAAAVDDAALKTAIGVVEEALSSSPLLVTSVKERLGVDELRAAANGRTVVLLGESGAGKSTIVNALLGTDTVATAAVRAGDSKGRHTTTSRQLHVVPGGSVVIDTPGIRAVGLWVDPDSVDETFADLDELAAECRFADCGHEGEPGCAVATAVADGRVDATRVVAWQALRAEAEATIAPSWSGGRNQRRRRR